MIKLLKGYIDLIRNESLKELVLSLFSSPNVQHCLEKPSSYSGHNHPEDEFVKLGQLKHTLRVCNLAIQLYRSCVGTTPEGYDIVIAGSLLHDVPYKFNPVTGYTELNHAVQNAKWFYMMATNKIEDELRDKITSCILNHMGKWEVSRDTAFSNFLPSEYSWCVHLADNLSSRKNIIVDITTLDYLKENLY